MPVYLIVDRMVFGTYYHKQWNNKSLYELCVTRYQITHLLNYCMLISDKYNCMYVNKYASSLSIFEQREFPNPCTLIYPYCIIFKYHLLTQHEIFETTQRIWTIFGNLTVPRVSCLLWMHFRNSEFEGIHTPSRGYQH